MSIYSVEQLFQYSASLTPSHHQEGDQPLGTVASFSGVLSMMENLLGEEFDQFREKLHSILELVDTYGASLLNRDMFEDFIHLIMQADLFDGGTESTVNTSDDEELGSTKSYGNYRIETILQGDGKYSSQKWKMLYCGGSNAVRYMIFILPIPSTSLDDQTTSESVIEDEVNNDGVEPLTCQYTAKA
eukprot:scaffold176355_cov55-Cyclotella_meneghiniana.AAC.1